MVLELGVNHQEHEGKKILVFPLGVLYDLVHNLEHVRPTFTIQPLVGSALFLNS